MYKSHVYLAFGGSIGPDEGYEEFSTGVRMGFEAGLASDDPPPLSVLNEFLDENILEPLQDWFSSANTYIHPLAKLRWAKFNLIGEDGRYVYSDTVENFFQPISGGGSAGAAGMTYPSQVSLAVTLETAASRGYANKGRMFLPCPSMGLTAAGLIGDTQAQTVADNTKNFLDAITDGVEDGSLNRWDFFPTVQSKLGNGGDGTQRRVTAVSVDTRLDIQRSRAKSLRGSRKRTALA